MATGARREVWDWGMGKGKWDKNVVLICHHKDFDKSWPLSGFFLFVFLSLLLLLFTQLFKTLGQEIWQLSCSHERKSLWTKTSILRKRRKVERAQVLNGTRGHWTKPGISLLLYLTLCGIMTALSKSILSLQSKASQLISLLNSSSSKIQQRHQQPK